MTSCTHCTHKDAYIKALEAHIRALEIVIINSQRSLAAEGRQLRKTREQLQAAKQKVF